MKKESFPSVSEMMEMYYCFVETFFDAGYVQQFPYQFVKKGKEMQFLENQWSSGEFVGIGTSSCSFVAGWDYNNAMPAQAYIEKVNENGVSASTGKRLSQDEAMKRFVALGLKQSGVNRINAGIERKRFEEIFGKTIDKEFGPWLEELKELGLVEDSGTNVSLSSKGLFFHDEIARKLF